MASTVCNRQFLYVVANALVLFILYNIFLTGDVSHSRSRRSAGDSSLDQFLTSDVLDPDSDGPRFVRKVLNESDAEGYLEDGGTKKPKSIKDLNQNYTEAKMLYYGKINCQKRNQNTTAAPGGRRKRRGAFEITTGRIYYCDEFTTTTPLPTTAAPK